MSRYAWLVMLPLLAGGLFGCASSRTYTHRMEVTAYSSDRISTEWERGSWRYLKLDFWNKYNTTGSRKGGRYDGRTASGVKPREVNRGPLGIPLPRKGTIAADTNYYPFGTRMHVPGYGWGVVEDRGGAIKGPDRIDIYYRSRKQALQWGRRHVDVKIRPE